MTQASEAQAASAPALDQTHPQARFQRGAFSLLVVSCRGWWVVTEPRCYGIFWLSVRLLRGP